MSLGAVRIGRLQQLLEMGDVVVTPDLLLASGPAHALDHRVVVERVREDQAVRHQRGDGRDAREVRDPAGGEDEPGLLAVKVGELGFELDDAMMGAGDVARAACAGAVLVRRGGRRAAHVRVAAHAEVVVRAPDRHFARLLASARAPERGRETRRVALEVDEHPIALLVLQALHCPREMGVALVLIRLSA